MAKTYDLLNHSVKYVYSVPTQSDSGTILIGPNYLQGLSISQNLETAGRQVAKIPPLSTKGVEVLSALPTAFKSVRYNKISFSFQRGQDFQPVPIRYGLAQRPLNSYNLNLSQPFEGTDTKDIMITSKRTFRKSWVPKYDEFNYQLGLVTTADQEVLVIDARENRIPSRFVDMPTSSFFDVGEFNGSPNFPVTGLGPASGYFYYTFPAGLPAGGVVIVTYNLTFNMKPPPIKIDSKNASLPYYIFTPSDKLLLETARTNGVLPADSKVDILQLGRAVVGHFIKYPVGLLRKRKVPRYIKGGRRSRRLPRRLLARGINIHRRYYGKRRR